MCGKVQASGLTEFFPSYTPWLYGASPVSLHTLLLPFPQLFSSHHEGGSILWIALGGALIHVWRPEIADDTPCILICRRYFHFTLTMHNVSNILFSSFIFISWRPATLQHCSGLYHTPTWISHGFTYIPHPGPPSHLPLHPIPLGLPSAPGPSTCLMHPTWAGDLFHPR